MGNAEHKIQSYSKGKSQSDLKRSMRDSRTVHRSKVPLDIKEKAKSVRESKPPVPKRTSSLKADDADKGLGMQGPMASCKEVGGTCLPPSRFVGSIATAKQNLDVKNGTQTEDLETNLEPKLIVAAIDFGTTYSGYAFAFTHDHIDMDGNSDKIFASNWENEGGSGLYQKTPTCLLLDPDANFHSFGSAAMDKYSSLTDDNKHHDWYFFWQFKMVLHQKEVSCRHFV